MALTAARLVLIAATWAHPAALTAPFLIPGQIRDNSRGDDFTKSCRASIAAEDLTAAAHFAEQAHLTRARAPSFIPIGQLRSQILHREQRRPWIPPSGWFDLAEFLPTTRAKEIQTCE